MFYYVGGLFFSYLYSLFILPKNSGHEPNISPTIYPIMYKGMVIIPLNKEKSLHIHHWMIYLFICLMGYFYTIPKLVLGFSFGLFLQGILYNDRCNLICDNPYNK